MRPILDTSILFHNLEDVFDRNNWRKVYNHYVPWAAAASAASSPSAAGGSAGTGAGGAIPTGTVDWEVEQVAQAIKKCATLSLRAGKEDNFNIS